jgi:hypothetical protein
MNKLGFSVLTTSLVVVLYVVVSTLPVEFGLVFGFFLLAHGLLIWMVLVILKDKNPSKRTFDEYFYEDVDIRRNNPRS